MKMRICRSSRILFAYSVRKIIFSIATHYHQLISLSCFPLVFPGSETRGNKVHLPPPEAKILGIFGRCTLFPPLVFPFFKQGGTTQRYRLISIAFWITHVLFCMNIEWFFQLKQCISEDFYCEKPNNFPPPAGIFSAQNPVPKHGPEKYGPEISILQKVRGGWDLVLQIKLVHP